jgi:hypothetical protein
MDNKVTLFIGCPNYMQLATRLQAHAAQLAADLGQFYIDKAFAALENESEFRFWFWQAVGVWAIERRLTEKETEPDLDPIAAQFAAILQDKGAPMAFDGDYQKLLDLYQDGDYDD